MGDGLAIRVRSLSGTRNSGPNPSPRHARRSVPSGRGCGPQSVAGYGFAVPKRRAVTRLPVFGPELNRNLRSRGLSLAGSLDPIQPGTRTPRNTVPLAVGRLEHGLGAPAPVPDVRRPVSVLAARVLGYPADRGTGVKPELSVRPGVPTDCRVRHWHPRDATGATSTCRGVLRRPAWRWLPRTTARPVRVRMPSGSWSGVLRAMLCGRTGALRHALSRRYGFVPPISSPPAGRTVVVGEGSLSGLDTARLPWLWSPAPSGRPPA